MKKLYDVQELTSRTSRNHQFHLPTQRAKGEIPCHHSDQIKINPGWTKCITGRQVFNDSRMNINGSGWDFIPNLSALWIIPLLSQNFYFCKAQDKRIKL